jgi:four helix bundle protein
MTEDVSFGFEHLEVWKKAREFKKEVCEEARKFSLEEKFRLIDQILRSSRSINALLSEGHGRFTYADQLHYCVQSRGSLTESINHLIDAYDDEYITLERLSYFKTKGKELEKLINGCIGYLRKQRDISK